MTPKEIAETIIKVDESEGCYLVDIEVTYKVPELAKAYLALESRIQKLEAVAEASVAIVEEMRLRPFSPDTWVISNLREALAKLEQQ